MKKKNSTVVESINSYLDKASQIQSNLTETRILFDSQRGPIEIPRATEMAEIDKIKSFVTDIVNDHIDSLFNIEKHNPQISYLQDGKIEVNSIRLSDMDIVKYSSKFMSAWIEERDFSTIVIPQRSEAFAKNICEFMKSIFESNQYRQVLHKACGGVLSKIINVLGQLNDCDSKELNKGIQFCQNALNGNSTETMELKFDSIKDEMPDPLEKRKESVKENYDIRKDYNKILKSVLETCSKQFDSIIDYMENEPDNLEGWRADPTD